MPLTLTSLAESFHRTQRAEGLSPATIALYRNCLKRLIRHLPDDDLSALTRRNLTDYLALRSATVKPASVWTDYKCAHRWVAWLVSEDELTTNVMAKMRPPRQPVTPVATYTDDELSRLLAACEGRGRRERRDMALMRLLVDTGLRRGEASALRPDDILLDQGLAMVTGKGKTRYIAFGPKTAVALERWLRMTADMPPLRGGTLFGLTPSGLYQTVVERGKRAGVQGTKTHRHRHTWATHMLQANVSESDLMLLAGWSESSMVRRYTAASATERAIATARRVAIGDRL